MKTTENKFLEQQRVAVAIDYDDTHITQGIGPTVAAVGRRKLADAIQQQALRYGIPVVHDSQLVKSLQGSRSGSKIKKDLYNHVAQVFVKTEKTRK